MRYCQIYDPVTLGRVTLKQYFLMMKAVQLQLVDKQRDLHIQAWLNMQVKATKQRGKKTVPYFKTFNDFFKDPHDGKMKPTQHQPAMKPYGDLKKMMLKANTSLGSES
ncbi:MAG: hypothetical protein FWG67_08505 [Defluviitaleaceae bacterium]|nr:hypothetical protein [Defluviitaleaceae bacterium]